MNSWLESIVLLPTGGGRDVISKKTQLALPKQINVKTVDDVRLKHRTYRALYRSAVKGFEKTTYEEWDSIPIPAGLKPPEHIQLSEYVVMRTPEQIDNAMEVYKHKTMELLRKYDLGNYDVRIVEKPKPGLRHSLAYTVGYGYRKHIALVRPHMCRLPDNIVFDIVLHEIAHALDKTPRPVYGDPKLDHGHGPVWQKICLAIGGNGERFYDGVDALIGYVYQTDLEQHHLAVRCADAVDPCIRVYDNFDPETIGEYLVSCVNKEDGAVDSGKVCRRHQKPFVSLVYPPPFQNAGDYAKFLFEKFPSIE